MIRGFIDSPLYGDGQFGWDPHPRIVSQDRQNSNSGAPARYMPFEERPARRPFSIPSFPSELYPATRIIVIGNRTSHGTNPPRLPEPPQWLVPRLNGPERMHVRTQSDGSKLTKEEQEMVLKKLRKEIYNPMPKILARVSLYYRDLNKEPNAKATEKQQEEDGKSCAVCLEEFEPREEVMLTPCRHMFHEECIVPWVKDHGQCPVCRTDFHERRVNSSTSNGNNRQVVAEPADRRVLFSDDLRSLIHAVDEAFLWRIRREQLPSSPHDGLLSSLAQES